MRPRISRSLAEQWIADPRTAWEKRLDLLGDLLAKS